MRCTGGRASQSRTTSVRRGGTLALPESPSARLVGAVVIADGPGETRLDAAADLGAVEGGVPHQAPFLAGRQHRQLPGQAQFDDVGVAVGGAFVFGHGRRIVERELNVIGRGPAEVADHEFDHVPVGGMRLHEHPDVRAGLLRGGAAVAGDLAVGEDQCDDGEGDRRPRCPRYPGAGPDVRDPMPAVLDPTHGIHPPLISQGRTPKGRHRAITHPSAFAIGQGPRPDTHSWTA